jgi:hypothetical protein
LGKVANLAGALNLSLGRLAIAGKYLGKCRLSGAVSTHQTDFVTGRNSKVHITHQGSSTYCDLEVPNAEQKSCSFD